MRYGMKGIRFIIWIGLILFLVSCSRKKVVIDDLVEDTLPSATLVSISITPKTPPRIAVGVFFNLKVSGKYSDQSTQNIFASWTSSSPEIATVDSTGKVTGKSVGVATIKATSGGFSDSVTVTVDPKKLDSISVTPTDGLVFIGNKIPFKATAHFNDNTSQDFTSQVTWTSSFTSIATIDSAGLAKGVAAGTTTIIASTGLIESLPVILRVQEAKLLSIRVTTDGMTSDGMTSTPVGIERQFKATGTYQGNGPSATQDMTLSVQWSTSNGAIATINTSGVAKGVSSGIAMITATLGSIVSPPVRLEVTNANLLSILVTPQNSTLLTDTTQQFIATGYYDNETSLDLTSQVIWVSSTSTVATISNSAPQQGKATAISEGTTTVSATLGATIGTTTLTVIRGTLKSISVTPENASIAIGTTQQLKAEGTYERTIVLSDATSTTTSLVLDISSYVVWNSSNQTAVSVNVGLATATTPGVSTITATLGAISGTTSLTVTLATLSSIVLTPDKPSIFVGGKVKFQATGIFSNNTSQDLNDEVLWGSSAPTFAEIDIDSGIAVGRSPATVLITATFDDDITGEEKTGSTTLTVDPAQFESISISPQDKIIAQGTKLQFKAMGINNEAEGYSEQDITELVKWSSPKYASISNDPGTIGLATGISAGEATITASLPTGGGSVIKASTKLTITGAVLTGINVYPNNPPPSIPVGIHQQFTAIGIFNNDSTQDITSSVLWTIDSTDVATLSQTGLAVAKTVGKTIVRATSGSISGMTTLDVNTGILDAIDVTPKESSIGVGTTLQYSATATFNDNPTTTGVDESGSYDITSYASWSSSSGSVAIISSTGLAVGVSEGTTTISAQFLEKNSSTSLHVKKFDLQSIAVTPTGVSIPVGGKASLKAIGTFADGSTQDLTNKVNWFTTSYLTATVSNASGSQGVVTGIGQGSTDIKAVLGQVVGVVNVKVGGAAPNLVAAGGDHTCTVLTNGQMKCWGKNFSKQLGNQSSVNSPVPVGVAVAGGGLGIGISPGGSHTCSVFNNGIARCWGDNQFGQLGIGTTIGTGFPANVKDQTGSSDLLGAKKMAAGLFHTCLLLDSGGVKCWGENSFGQLGNGTNSTSTLPVLASLPLDIISVSSGNAHTCALSSGGSVRCWGKNSSGQLGIGSTDPSNVPVTVNITTVMAIAAGGDHTCALLSNGKVRCWGKNESGQLGLGSGETGDKTSPSEISTLSNVTAIAAGGAHTCAVTNGTVKCWGKNSSGQLGNNTTTDSPNPDPVDVQGFGAGDVIADITAGASHTCALLAGGVVKCWGSNRYGQLGNNVKRIATTPVLLPGTGPFTDVQSGSIHTCTLSGGGVSCVGDNRYSQLGDGTTTSTDQPVSVIGIPSPATAVSVSAGDFHSCARLSDNTIKCWGVNFNGQLGNLTSATSTEPVSVLNITTANMIAMGGDHSCALLANGSINCWGKNSQGQLGNNTQYDQIEPVLVLNLSATSTAVSAGDLHTCAILSDSTVACWGDNASGQLGISATTTEQSLVPIPIPTSDLSNVLNISTGAEHACAVMSSGLVKCWGENDSKQLGVTMPGPLTPVLVNDLPSASAVTTGDKHTCALLTTSGKVNCWGGNDSGQLGNGTTSESSSPVEVIGISNATAITAGDAHTCALLLDGTVKCWGDDSYGQIGNNVDLIEKLPVFVSGFGAE